MAIFSAIAAGKARKAQERAQKKLDEEIAGRQDIINPYENVADLSAQISNPFANLQVATGAAEMQAEQADISLANTLDTLRATGAGSAGATALAQAAARSKQGIAATIQQQEAQNARLRAQGEQAAMGARLGEARRLQEADILGRTFQFQAQEAREIADISRQAGMVQQYGQQRFDALGQMGASTGAVLGAFAGGVGTGLGRNIGSGKNNSSGGGSGNQSDRRLKKDIKFLRLSPSGLKIYSFKYKNQDGIYEGVISDEIPNYAVVKNFRGIYDGVDYSKIDVQFKRVT